MKLTAEQIKAGQTPKGGYRLAQLIALGYKPERPGQWPVTGWKVRLTKREITEAQYAEFMRLATTTRKSEKKRMKREREPDLFHKNAQKETRDQAALDFANREWVMDRDGFERIPTRP